MNTTFEADAMGGNVRPIAESDIKPVTFTNPSLQSGLNILSFSMNDTVKQYGFLEVIVTGEYSDGKKVCSEVCFAPYRKQNVVS